MSWKKYSVEKYFHSNFNSFISEQYTCEHNLKNVSPHTCPTTHAAHSLKVSLGVPQYTLQATLSWEHYTRLRAGTQPSNREQGTWSARGLALSHMRCFGSLSHHYHWFQYLPLHNTMRERKKYREKTENSLSAGKYTTTHFNWVIKVK